MDLSKYVNKIQEFRARYEKPEALMDFARDILGYDQLWGPVHQPVVDVLCKEVGALFLLPRGHLKSTLITIAYTIHQIVMNPNIRIYIANAVLDQSIKFGREIRQHMEENVLLREVWPEVFWKNPSKDSLKWTEDELVVRRTRNMKEATITVGSVGKETTGSHYDIQIYDDLVNMENVSTPDQIEKVKAWYKMSLSLLEPNGKKWVVGTRYDFSDMYGELLETSMPRIVRRCIENGKPIMPNRFTLKRLDDVRQEQGSYIFSCQYMNDPVDQDTAPFKRDHVQYWKALPRLNLYILVDLAISDKDRACETAIIVAGFSETGQIYVIDDVSGIFTPLQTIEHLYALSEKYNKPPLGIERMQVEKALRYLLEEEGKKRGKWLNYTRLKPDMDKFRRIVSSLQPFWEQDKIFLAKNMFELENQFLRFPKYSKRDRLDALAYIVQMASRPGNYVTSVSFKADYGSIWEKLDHKIKRHAWAPEKKETNSFMTF